MRFVISRKIARRRGPQSAKNYALVGGRSPIHTFTERQRAALEARLNEGRGSNRYRCAVAMRYSPPFTADAISALDRAGFREIVVLPLYPQESRTTTGSSLAEADRVLEEMNFDRGAAFLTKIAAVRDYANHPLLLQAFKARIDAALAQFAAPANVHILFSAHGLPVRCVEQGDPYERRVLASVDGIVRLLPAGTQHSLAYQSRVGPERWLEPDAAREIERLAGEGVENILTVPIAFVSDHIETLHEIRMVYADLARRCGIQQFECAEGLNDSPIFIALLASLVEGAVSAPALL